MSASSCVTLDALARHFGEVRALDGIGLEIREGETFGLLGPNGAGKTTTLSLLATLLPPTSGDALVFGTSLRDDPTGVRRLVGLAPQQISLYPDLTGEENLRFFGRLHGVHGARLTARCRELLDRVGLTPRKDERVRRYSGGMQRRLNLACALVHEPRLLLLDEPTAGVDPQSRENLFGAIEKLAAEGATVLYTTHYMEEAERLCDRIAILDEGRVAAVGTLSELLEIVGMGEVIEIRSKRADRHGERISGIDGVVHARAQGAVLRVFVQSAARVLAPIGAALEEVGGEVESLEVYPVDLERVFLHLTGKELRD